jgi:hypothetical protein
MYQTTGSRRHDVELGGLGRSIAVEDPSTHVRCQADERRIHPVVEPAPTLLVPVDATHLRHPSANIRLHHAAYAGYIRLKQAAEVAGVPSTLLTIVSGYRSVATQAVLWERALRRYGTPEAARVYVAPPGGSPHHSGRAIDFYLGVPNDSANIAALRSTPAYRWMVCNAVRFGFTPYSAEPWHWEFNPPGLRADAPRITAMRPSRLGVRTSPRAQFGYFADGPARPTSPGKTAIPKQPSEADWTITHTDRGRFLIKFVRPMREESVLKQLFTDSKLPPGFTLQPIPNSNAAQWFLFVPSGMGVAEQAGKLTPRLGAALGKAVDTLSLTPEEAAAAHEKIRTYNERISKVYLPFLGMTFGEARKTYGLGWFESGGYFVWIGVTTSGTQLQAIPLSKTESINRDIRYYLNKGMSLEQAQREILDRGVEMLRMLVVGMMAG